MDIPLYFERDGVFMRLLGFDGGLGYTFDWDDMFITITDQDDDEIQFDIHIMAADMSYWPEVEWYPHTIPARAVRENGVWLLDQIYY